MKRVLMPIGILLGSIVITVVLIRNPTRVSESAPEIIPISVRVAEVRSESVQLFIESQGKAQAARQASLSSNVQGPVAWVSPSLEAGAYVKAGEPLLRLELADFETAVARSRATYEQASAEAEFAAADLARITELAAKRLASESELQNAERAATVTSARLADAEAALEQSELDAERSILRAPFNAVVASRDVELGQFVNRAQSVAVLFDADSVDVRVPLAIRQLGYLDVPMGFRGEFDLSQAPQVELVGSYGGKQYKWEGKLLRTEATIDPNSNTVQSIIRIEQPTADLGGETIPLPIGLFVEARIAGKLVEDIISLPRSAIRNNSQVLVVDAENKMYYRDVDIFRLEQDRVLISGGLVPGEKICTSPIQAVVDGMSVRPVLEMI
ncbi:MAG: efflux RND transporter periplasmic adaptor subunit [Proteobacteria bacterium]|nr:efflux RND transporter periplasmic adaptor subunit [Pseudomonadota bacterium]MDA0896344.1 efflux RND transporter periplasmic adaptor subunit [Pseudomonadota bacterium]